MSHDNRPSPMRMVLLIAALLASTSSTHAAAVVRHFEFGESDLNLSGLPAQVGDMVVSTHNLLGETFLPDNPTQMDLSPIAGTSPVYVEGRNGPGSLAIGFDGSTNEAGMFTGLRGNRFCTWCPDTDTSAVMLEASGGSFSSTFSLGKQLWIKPDPTGIGLDQVIIADGFGDPGGVGISAEGTWVHITSNTGLAQFIDTGVPVRFGEWTHVAQFIPGVPSFFYVDGVLSDVQSAGLGFGGGNSPISVGSAFPNTDTPFIGAVDDLKLMVTSSIVGGFDPAADLDFFEGQVFSGILGDVNQDGVVDQADVDIWMLNVGLELPVVPLSLPTRPSSVRMVAQNNPGALLLGDVNQNGIIDLTDFSIIKHAAQAQGNLIVPEPGTLALLGLGMLTLRLKRIARVSKRKGATG